MFTVRLFYQNVRGLRTKLGAFNLSALAQQHHAICISETWLDDAILYSELPEGYSTFRCDRDRDASRKSTGGGVLIAIKDSLPAELVFSSSGFPFDCVALRVSPPNFLPFIVSCVYVPCASPSHLYEELFDSLSELLTVRFPSLPFFLCGDFNLPMLNWPNHPSLPIPSNNLSHSSLPLSSFMYTCSALNFNTTKNSLGRTLDLFLSNLPERHLSLFPGTSPYVKTDAHHPAVEFEAELPRSKPKTKRKPTKFNFRKANFDGLNSALASFNWVHILSNSSCDQALNTFYNILSDLLSCYVPSSPPCLRSYPTWFTTELHINIRLKHTLRKKFRASKNDADLAHFKAIRSTVKSMVRKARKRYLLSVEAALARGNLKPFWSHARNSRNPTQSVPSSISFADSTANSPQQSCDLLCTYFSSVFSPSSPSPSTPFITTDSSESLAIPLLTPSLVEFLIGNLDPNVGPGPDGLPNLFLLNCRKHISLPLCIIYNKSLDECYFPRLWKEALIIPILKSGDPSLAVNYRPISLLSSCSKILERYVNDWLTAHFGHLIVKEQHGFVKHRSTASNLLVFTNFVAKRLNSRQEVHAVYTDFSKAFDTVDHNILLSKLSSLDFPPSVISWLSSYLSYRSCKVSFHGHSSRSFSPSSGVPQGSILGPLLFLFFINDLASILTCPYLLYADDLKLFASVSSPLDCALLQSNLDNLARWCSVNKLTLNVNKCHWMRYSLKPSPSSFSYSLSGQPLSLLTSFKDLGVIFDDKLRFNSHFVDIINRASKMSGFILRSSSDFTSIQPSLTLFNSLVKNILEYCCVVWSPYRIRDGRALEAVQRKFTRTLFYKKNLPRVDYPSRLRTLNLPSLQQRRIFLDMCTLFKLCNGLMDCSANSDITFRIASSHNTRNADIFDVPFAELEIYFHSPIPRFCRSYNALQLGSFDSMSLSSFKRKICHLLAPPSEDNM